MLHSKDIEWLNGYKNKTCGTSLVVQCLRLCTSNAEGTGSFPGSGTKIPHASWCGQKKTQDDPCIYYLSSDLKAHRLKVRGEKKVFHAK